MDFALENVFGLRERLSAANADEFYGAIEKKLQTPEFLPRALFERFNIEVLSTTDSAFDSLEYHRAIKASGWKGRVLPTFRPDAVVDAEFLGFQDNLKKLGEVSGEDVSNWKGYLAALRSRRAFFKKNGATATDHGHLTAQTADLPLAEAERLYQRIFSGRLQPGDVELFQAQMLTEMAGMSVEDGLTMQLHPGSIRNYNAAVYEKFGRDKGADIPSPTEYVRALRPLLTKYGNEPNLTLILFTLDETTYSRELAPLAGHFPSVKLGPPWWFLDSPEGMMRFRESRDRDGGLLQHGRLQRRHARVSVDPGAARRGPPRGLRVPGAAGRRTPPGRGRGVRSGERPGREPGAQGIQVLRFGADSLPAQTSKMGQSGLDRRPMYIYTY